MKVGLFGDSQAEGLEVTLGSLLADRGMELVFSGARRGYTTGRYLSEGVANEAPRGLDLAVVVLGGNDSVSSSYEATLERAVATFKAHARKILWIGPSYSTDAQVERRHTATRLVQARVLPRLGVTFRDPLNWQLGTAARRAPDGTHFVRDAYELQAEAVALEAQALLTRPAAWAITTGALLGLSALFWVAGMGGRPGRHTVARRRRRR